MNEPGKCQYCGKERTAGDGHTCEPIRFSANPFNVTGFSLPNEDGDGA